MHLRVFDWGLANPGPSPTRTPDQRRSGLRVFRAAPTRRRNIHTHAPFRTERQSFLRCRDMRLTISRKQRSGHAAALRRQRPQVRILSGAPMISMVSLEHVRGLYIPSKHIANRIWSRALTLVIMFPAELGGPLDRAMKWRGCSDRPSLKDRKRFFRAGIPILALKAPISLTRSASNFPPVVVGLATYPFPLFAAWITRRRP